MDVGSTRAALEPERFAAAWQALGARDTRAFEQLVARYAEPHRAYHTAEHVQECLRWLDAVRDLAERPNEIAVALYFHDIVYEPLACDNERASASLALERAFEAGIAHPVARYIAGLIEATAHHEVSCGDAALLCDIDLAVLGSAPPRYARYAANVRREYARLDGDAYRRGRAQVLRSLLERIAIYTTSYFSSRLEAQARNNLAAELHRLEEGAGV